MNKTEFDAKFPGLMRRMAVRSIDGEKLGRVSRIDSQGFVIEKGHFFKHDQQVPFEEVQSLEAGAVILRRPSEHLQKLRELGRSHLWTGGFSNQTSLGEPGGRIGIADQNALGPEPELDIDAEDKLQAG